MIGDGEPNHGDLDGDGVAGEDWFNGHDDDGDGLIDEDYWYADGIDNQEPYNDICGEGDFAGTDNWYSCTDGFDYNDANQNGIHDGPEPFFDTPDENGYLNGVWDEGEWFQDLQGQGYTSGVYDYGEEHFDTFTDWDSDNAWDTFNGAIDEYIDTTSDDDRTSVLTGA